MEEDTSHTVATAITIDIPDVDDTSKKKDKDKIEENAEPQLDDNVIKTKLPYEKRTFTVGMALVDEFRNYGPAEHPIADADPWSRKRFIRNTFMIVFVMLLITAVCSGLVRIPGTVVNEVFLDYFRIISIGSSIAMLILTLMFGCVKALRSSPCIYFMIPLMVATLTLLTAAVTVRFKTDALLIAMAATLVICLVAVGLSFTRFDFTRWYAVVGFLFLGVMVASVITMVLHLAFGIPVKIVQLVLCIISTAALSLSLLMQFQMIIGGKSMEIEESQYFVAAFMVYTSIVYIFLNLLQMTELLDNL